LPCDRIEAKESRMRQNPLVLALASVGFAAAALAPALHASMAQERPAVIAQAAALPRQAPNPGARTIDDMFRDFTAEWVRNDPDLATQTRYLTGEEQDRLERQLTPRTQAWKRARIQLQTS
jgi:hypothetical protein